VGYDPATHRLLPFQETTKRRRKHGVAEAAATYPLRYYVFDLLDLDGENLMPLSMEERRRRLRSILRVEPDGTIQLTPETPASTPDELETLLARAVNEGMEGIMIKKPEAPYHPGTREYHWVKLKPEYAPGVGDTYDVVVVGYDKGRGRRANLGIGSLLCCVVDRQDGTYRTVTRVGSGLSDAGFIRFREQLDAIRIPTKAPRVDSLIVPDVWVEPRYVVEVAAPEITRSPLHTCGKVDGQPGYALRFPRIVRLREDRRPEDATTQVEVTQAYQRQSHQLP
jgi:DNA ligase-1